jgi:hypothetical protein
MPVRVTPRLMPPTRFLEQLSNILIKRFIGRVSLGARTIL